MGPKAARAAGLAFHLNCAVRDPETVLQPLGKVVQHCIGVLRLCDHMHRERRARGRERPDMQVMHIALPGKPRGHLSGVDRVGDAVEAEVQR